MRKLLLNTTPLFRKLRQLSLLLSLLLALPQTAWGKRYTTTGNVIDATGNNAGTRFTWETNATQTAEWRWVIDCEAGTVTSGISTLTFTLEPNKNITMSFGGSTDNTSPDYTKLRKFTFDGLSNELTVSAALTQESTTYNFTGSNGVFTPSGNTNSIDMNGVLNVTITNNSGNSVTCTINSITVLTGQIISSNELVWPTDSPINELTKSVSNNATTLSGSCAADTEFSFLLKIDGGSALTENDNYAIKYTSSNPSVAEVSDAGFVTIKGSGSTIITATLTENDYYSYEQSTYSYTLTNTETYGLTIAGTAVTSANASAITGTGITGTVSFDANNKILTLNGATIDGTIESSLAILSIHLTGTNLIRGNTTALLNGIKSTNGGTLTFTADASSTLHITTTGDAASAITDFADVTMGTGAYLQTDTPTKYDTNGKNFCWQVGSANIVKELNITSTPCYPLWIGNTQFTSTSTPTGFTFDATNNILTLTNVTQANPLISGLANLTIALSGDNSITKSDSSAVIRSINSQAALIIQKAGTGDGSLYLENNGSDPSASPVVKNFASINHTGLNYSSKSGNPINDATTHEAILSSATIYPLWIGNTPVTSTTTSGTGWSYDNNNKKLTLNGGTNTAPTTITGQIISGIGDLTIFLTGTTILKAADSETSLINSTNNGILSFDTNPTAIGSLAFKDNTGSAVFAGEPISGFTSKTYSNGLDYDATTKTIGVTTYDIVVDGQDINSANKTDVMNNGKVTYDSENRILTLNDGATIPSLGINVTSSSDLTVELNGSISVTGSTYAFNTNGGKINFVKGTGATNVELTATCGNGYPSISFSNITLGSGLYSKPIAQNSTIITTNPEFVIIEDYAMTDTRTITSTGTITYDSTNKVLTIDGFAKTDNSNTTSYIKSGVVGLTVKLKGNNAINFSASDYIFEAIGTGATILFDGTEGGKLDMQINSTSQPFGGFAEIKYNKLAYWNTTGNNHTIQAPTAPEMAPNANNEVELTKPYADGSIKYSIVYADGTAGVSDATYSAPFAMAAPGTVTAWVEANDVTTSTVKGKYFGYKDAPFTMLANETKTPELIPAIETGDYIDYATASTPYSSSEPGVATFDGTITAVAFGNTTLTTKMAYSGQTANVVILNYNNQFETVVKVAKSIDTMLRFVGNAQYATFCNTDADDWTLPDGITVYGVRIPDSGNEVELSEIKFIPGNSTGYFTVLLKRDDTSKTSFGTVTKYTRKATDNLPVNHLHFTSDPQGLTTNGKQYILYKDEFVKATGKIIGPVGYLENTTTNPARGFVIEGGNDGSTAIDDTLIDNEETENGEWYDLQGRRITKPTKAGLYIVNGKKVVVNNK